ncbi:hypothetical protein [Fibrobacter sp. UWT2]|uniref:hypothetical protein n=1 Tax=Fibrobacter sp. UWT2 TaxID=1896224 RepID=UPI001160A041|nr:hypothetical protein [Fibrobacter sp. UWT2]
MVVLEAAAVVPVARDAAHLDAVGASVGQGECVDVQLRIGGVYRGRARLARKAADLHRAEVAALDDEGV